MYMYVYIIIIWRDIYLKENVYSKINLESIKTEETDASSVTKITSKRNSVSKRKTSVRRNKTDAAKEAISIVPVQDKKTNVKRRAVRRSNTNSVRNKETASSNDLPTVQVISLGGLEEIGKNMTLIRCSGQVLIIDCGMAFPDDDLLGIDVVIPDFSYLENIKDEIVGLALTHGHEDHIGGIPFLLEKFNIPIYGTALTIGLVKNKLEETAIDSDKILHVVKAGQTIQLGEFSIEFIHTNHSIPDSVALCITTPGGRIVHTGDFKIDYTPVVEETADLRRFAEIGKQGVLALLCDSTNAERPGNSVSESVVGASFEALFSRTEGKRVIIATFASNVQRIQQIVDFAEHHKRKIAVSGRSMINTVALAKELGYLHYSEDTLIAIEDINRYKPDELVIITTGSQGEPMSALARMAAGTHRQVSISKQDMIIISATPIPGNEKTVTGVINSLLKLGSDVVYESMYEIHASGHACQNEIKLILSLIRPRYFMPVHGEYKHLLRNAAVAKQLGYDDKRIVLAEIGDVVSFSDQHVKITDKVESGKTLVDGIGVGDVGVAVLRDRQHLASDGMVLIVCSIDQNDGKLISEPDIISRGFVYMKDSEELIKQVKDIASGIVDKYSGNDRRRRSELKNELRSEIGNYLYSKTKRNPMILTLVTEI